MPETLCPLFDHASFQFVIPKSPDRTTDATVAEIKQVVATHPGIMSKMTLRRANILFVTAIR